MLEKYLAGLYRTGAGRETTWASARCKLLAMLLLLAWNAPAQVGSRALQPGYFQADAAAVQVAATSPIAPRLNRYRALTLDLDGLQTALTAAFLRPNAPLALTLPMPDGTAQRFAVWEAPLLAPALAARYPALHTYAGRGLDDASARLSLTISPEGLSVQVLTDQPTGAAYIEAARTGDATHYLNYYARDVQNTLASPGGCGAEALPAVPRPSPPARRASGPQAPAASAIDAVGPTLKVYRLVVTTTKEYTNLRSDAAVMTDVAAMINNVRTIQERDLAVTLTLVGTRFYQVGADGGYDQSGTDQALADRNRSNVETEFGAAAYDLGHLFTTKGTGIAYTGVVGTTATGGAAYTYKAGGVSGNAGRTSPASYFSTSVIAHEVGHQFAATHTFSNSQGSCSPFPTNSAWEPGKGSTIMAYADNGCDAPASNVIQSRSDDYYHTGSIEQMRTYIESIPAVGTAVSSGNSVPVLSVPADRTIPQGTPFKLAATATDADAADVLRYTWEQLDLGTAANLNTAQTANNNVPLFRSVLPSTEGATRYFPSLSNYNGAASTSTAERLPTVARTLKLRCTARDYHPVTGASAAATASGIVGGVTLSRTVTLTVSAANATPFAVTAPSATGLSWAGGSAQTVSWNGVGTKTSAVNCQTVNVRLSTNGGQSYPILLAAGVANADGTGTATVTLPNVATTTARILVEAADNYFFDVSDNNFAITSSPAAPAITSLSPASGAAGTVLTIKGTGFGTTAAELSVTVGGVAAPISAVTAAQVTVTVPTTALTGAVVLTKTGSGAGTAHGGVFQVTPVVTSISPAAGPVGAAVVISGHSFGGATRVSFNDVETTAFVLNTNVSPNTLTLNVPTGSTSGAVVVYTAGGPSNNTVTFAVVPFGVSSFVPAANAAVALEYSNLVATLNAPVHVSNAAAAPLKVTSLQAGGRKAGVTSASGAAITFDPTTHFHAGETVQYTLTTAATSNAGAALAQSYVGQYTVRTRTSSGLGAGTTSAVGGQPYAMATGDLNGDNWLDLVVANYNGGGASTVSVLLNDGTGAFPATATSTLSAGIDNGAQYVLLGDLNNDAQLDLLVFSTAGGTNCKINVLRGNGNGTFTAQASQTLAIPGVPALGDLNGDGNLDVVVPERYSAVGYIVIGLGNGNFGFTISRYTGVANGARAVALGDLNGDGRLDLVAAGYNGNSVSVRRGTGTGTFLGAADASSQDLSVSGPASLALADFTGDGYLDLAAAQPFTDDAPVSVWTGTATGALNPVATTLIPDPAGGQALHVYAADYDGDGTVELLAPLANAEPGLVQVFRYANGSFGVAASLEIAAAAYPRTLALADLNNDGALDLALPASFGNTVQVALATATGAPLPVELISFTAERQGRGALLRWATAQEMHSSHYEVEAAPDGQAFRPIGRLAGQGSSSHRHDYRFYDPNLAEYGAALVYYRLRQVDQDGTFTYSPVRVVVLTKEGDALAVHPNPARYQTTITGAEPGALVTVFDALGRGLVSTTADAAGTARLALPAGLPAGVYLIRSSMQMVRLVVE